MWGWLNARLHKTGGVWFWELGRVGGSFYVSSPAAYHAKVHRRHERALTRAMDQACAEIDHQTAILLNEHYECMTREWLAANA